MSGVSELVVALAAFLASAVQQPGAILLWGVALIGLSMKLASRKPQAASPVLPALKRAQSSAQLVGRSSQGFV